VRRGALGFALACASVVHAHEGPALDHFAWLKELNGACWVGDHPDKRTRDTQCFKADYGYFLHSTVQFSELRSGKWEPSFNGETVLAWDEKNQRISYWYWTSTGAYGPAEAYIEGQQIHFPASRKPGVNATEVRSTWTRIDANSFSVSRQKRQGAEGKWEELFAIVYRRVAN
jgi:hypothetical protein